MLRISRAWAAPSKNTFTIKPIKELIGRLFDGTDWVDPFAGWNSPAKYKNDLNPEIPVESHLDAQEFVEKFEIIDGILFDPPYSPRQISESYKGIGLKVGMREMQNAVLYARVKNAATPRISMGGLAICCGWNSCGFGKGRGFKLVELLIVCHGGGHNDTIVTVERKIAQLEKPLTLFDGIPLDNSPAVR